MIETHAGVIPHAALVRAQDVVVLNAVTLEQLVSAVVHADGEMDHDLGLGLGHDQFKMVGQIQPIRRIEHLADGLKINVVGFVTKTEFRENRLGRRIGCVRGHGWGRVLIVRLRHRVIHGKEMNETGRRPRSVREVVG